MFKLRPFLHADFESLYKLDQRCFAAGIAYSRAELSSYTARKGSNTVVAECVAPEGSPARAELAGFIVTEMDPRGYGHIITLDVEQRFRRQKLATKLLEAAEDYVAKQGGFMLVLEVAVDNLGAIDFYKKHGYKLVKTLTNYYDGRLDGLLMSRRF